MTHPETRSVHLAISYERLHQALGLRDDVTVVGIVPQTSAEFSTRTFRISLTGARVMRAAEGNPACIIGDGYEHDLSGVLCTWSEHIAAGPPFLKSRTTGDES